jgi:hypothetical protein
VGRKGCDDVDLERSSPFRLLTKGIGQQRLMITHIFIIKERILKAIVKAPERDMWL